MEQNFMFIQGAINENQKKNYRYTVFKDKKTKFHEDIYLPQFDL